MPRLPRNGCAFEATFLVVVVVVGVVLIIIVRDLQCLTDVDANGAFFFSLHAHMPRSTHFSGRCGSEGCGWTSQFIPYLAICYGLLTEDPTAVRSCRRRHLLVPALKL